MRRVGKASPRRLASLLTRLPVGVRPGRASGRAGAVRVPGVTVTVARDAPVQGDATLLRYARTLVPLQAAPWRSR